MEQSDIVTIRPNSKKIKVVSNIFTILFIILINIIYCSFYHLKTIYISINIIEIMIFFVLVIIGLFIHEFLQISLFLLFGVKRKNIKFICNRKEINTICNQEIKVGYYKIVMLIPFIILGVIPLICGYFIKDISLLNLSGILICCSYINDLIAFFYLNKYSFNTIIKDLKNQIGWEILKRV